MRGFVLVHVFVVLVYGFLVLVQALVPDSSPGFELVAKTKFFFDSLPPTIQCCAESLKKQYILSLSYRKISDFAIGWNRTNLSIHI